MQKAGIVAYLNDLALRYLKIARQCADLKTRIALEDISVELSNKARGLMETFTLPDRSDRQRPAHK